MTRRLAELFDLTDDDDVSKIDVQQSAIETDNSELPVINAETLKTIEIVERSLSDVQKLDKTDQELDELSQLAKDAFNNLLDLGMQVESRFSAEIFNSASSFLNHAITAKTAKINKKLKMIDLQLKKIDLQRKLDSVKPDGTPSGDENVTDLGTAQPIDRNELLKLILNRSQPNNQQKD